MAANKTRLTPAEDERLLELRAEGYTFEQLALAFPHRTQAEIRNRFYVMMREGRATRMKRANAWTDAEIEIIKQMRPAGARSAKLRAALPGRSVSAIDKQIMVMIDSGEIQSQHQYAIPRLVPVVKKPPSRTIADADKERIDALFRRAVLGGINEQTLGELFGCSTDTVARRKRIMGIISPSAPKPETVRRQCLGPCGEMRDIEAHLRICGGCKATTSWQSGADLAFAGVSIRDR